MNKLKTGDKVCYIPNNKNGILKSVIGNYAFVVYKWNNESKNFMNYTGCRTNIQKLKLGWNENENDK